jgi:hypothetical protein
MRGWVVGEAVFEKVMRSEWRCEESLFYARTAKATPLNSSNRTYRIKDLLHRSDAVADFEAMTSLTILLRQDGLCIPR